MYSGITVSLDCELLLLMGNSCFSSTMNANAQIQVAWIPVAQAVTQKCFLVAEMSLLLEKIIWQVTTACHFQPVA